MWFIVLIVFMAGGGPPQAIVKGHHGYGDEKTCRAVIEEHLDQDLEDILIEVDKKWNQHMHVAVSCAKAGKHGFEPDV